MVELEDWFYKYNSWSFSKHRLWNSCKLAYYYQYIGPALKNPEELDVKILRELKELKNKFALQGILIHEVIEDQISQYQNGKNMSEEKAKEQYIKRLENHREKADETIVEYYNGAQFNPKFFDYARSDGIDKLGIFYGVIWPQFKDLEYINHEEFGHFKINGSKCVIKADYVTKTNNNIIVVSDWKTGQDKEEYESDLQIGTYVLWAMDNYSIELDRVRSETVYLTTGRRRKHDFSTEQIDSIEEKICEEYSEMNESYEKEHFPPNPEPKRCLSCQFATVCDHSLAENAIGGELDD